MKGDAGPAAGVPATGESVPSSGNDGLQMARRRITLRDGRYMLFYTFEPSDEKPAEGADASASNKPPAGGTPGTRRSEETGGSRSGAGPLV